MKCAWEALIQIIPPRLRGEVDRLGKETLQELRFRQGQPVEMVMNKNSICLKTEAGSEDIAYIVSMASRYSPWAAVTASKGYITARGGHRIGVCGDVVLKSGEVAGIRVPYSLCIRVARDFPGIGKGVERLSGNLLILGPPGCGKTTLLRDIIRQKSNAGSGCIAVVDERGELFPMLESGSPFPKGLHTDIITGCDKASGIDMVLRTMGPEWIAVDEITAERDCRAIEQAGWCGVGILATAHAADVTDLICRPVYRHLAASGLFRQALVLTRDKSWRLEEIPCCTSSGLVHC